MASIEELMGAFSGAKPSLLKGDDADKEANFRKMIARETDTKYGMNDPAPSSLPKTVSIATMKGGK